MRYCDDGQIEIDNNAAERTLRTVAPSRKNDLFAGADTGGERVAAIYSLGGADCSFQGEPRQPGGVGIKRCLLPFSEVTLLIEKSWLALLKIQALCDGGRRGLRVKVTWANHSSKFP